MATGFTRQSLDYMKFIRMWLNDGQGPGGRVLKKETVEMAAKNGLPGDMKIKGLPGVIPSLSNYAEFFPGMPKSWALTFMINDHDAPTGRPAGALAWAGLANLYFWIDRKNGVGGFWATQILPFADPASVGGYIDFESAVYGAERQSGGLRSSRAPAALKPREPARLSLSSGGPPSSARSSRIGQSGPIVAMAGGDQVPSVSAIACISAMRAWRSPICASAMRLTSRLGPAAVAP